HAVDSRLDRLAALLDTLYGHCAASSSLLLLSSSPFPSTAILRIHPNLSSLSLTLLLPPFHRPPFIGIHAVLSCLSRPSLLLFFPIFRSSVIFTRISVELGQRRASRKSDESEILLDVALEEGRAAIEVGQRELFIVGTIGGHEYLDVPLVSNQSCWSISPNIVHCTSWSPPIPSSNLIPLPFSSSLLPSSIVHSSFVSSRIAAKTSPLFPSPAPPSHPHE
ncbi:hypothetical protein PFISCL1PPCAC_18489, partial [Pristionchus fissidentatus]